MSTLPPNWIETEIGNLAQVVAGGTPQASDETNFAEPGTGIAWLTPADLSGYKHKEIAHGKRDLTKKGLDSSSAKLMPKGAVVFSSRAPIGYVAIAANEICTNQGFKNFVFTEHVHPSYAFYYLKSIKDLADSWGTGTTFKELSGAVAKKLPFKLAPLNEQIRIADKLDSILAKVNKAQERLEKISGILKRFRQSVLAAATSGELTREWRGNDVIVSTEIAGLFVPVEWQFCAVEDIGVVKGGKRLPKGDELTENNTGFPYIRAGQLKNGTVVQGDSARNRQMFLAPETQAQIKRYTVNEGDVYLTIVGASIGDAGVIPHALHQANLTENAAKITNFNEKISAQYLSIWLRSERLQELIQLEIKSGAQGKLALKRINTLPVPLPPIAEQHEIVSIVEVLLSRAETLDRSYQLVKSRVDRLAQSILAKAFRGELVDQNPSDEPADMLLERIKQQQREAPKATRQTSKPAAKVIPSVYVVETDVELTPPESEIFALLKNTRGELSAQQIMDKLTEKTFEQVDALFTELKRLLDNNAIVKVGSGEACTFKAIKR